MRVRQRGKKRAEALAKSVDKQTDNRRGKLKKSSLTNRTKTGSLKNREITVKAEDQARKYYGLYLECRARR